ncbi:MAG: MBL fold metallo-hydrolase [Bacilli bacterium]
MMKITALVENISNSELKQKHGLSFYIDTDKHKILFDLGSDNTVFENARIKNIDLTKVDIVIISHGHKDHGGALEEFLRINTKAKVYIQETAFESYYTKILFFKIPIGLDKSLKEHSQIILLNGDFEIDSELLLFTVNDRSLSYSPMNNALYNSNGLDEFTHEQNLIINEKSVTLIMGCGHSGVANILKIADKYKPEICIGGFHLTNPITRRTVSKSLRDDISKYLQAYNGIQFHTCHCTGMSAFKYLQRNTNNLHYFHCGDTIEI